MIDQLMAAGLSRYISEHQLGCLFPEISGIVTMSDGADAWVLDGGVSPQMYRVLCEELGLTVPKSSARAKRFDSYSRSYC